MDLQMSHRLKLNAIHFASSLENEKALLDTSTDTLGSELHRLVLLTSRKPRYDPHVEERSLSSLAKGERDDMSDAGGGGVCYCSVRLDIPAYTVHMNCHWDERKQNCCSFSFTLF